MSSSMATPETPPQSSQPRPSISNHKPFIYFVSSFLMILLAVSVSFPRSSLSPRKLAIFNKFLWFVHSIPDKMQNQSPKPHFCVLWMAPFLSGGGYSSEAWSYITAIHGNIKNPLFRLAIEHHGDLESVEFWEGLPQHMKALALRLHQTQCNMNETIVICHSEPGAWYPPLFRTFPCPPSARRGDFLSLVGRTMFETDRVNPEHVNRCNQMDFIWVPTQFHVSTFTQSGVDPSKVVKVVQPVDVDFFDPLNYEPLDLRSVRKLVLGKPRYSKSVPNREFVFLSVFKWEYRKGWDVLLKAYLKEFSHDDGVALYLLTNPYHSDDDFGNEISVFVKDSKIERPIDGWALTYVIDSHVAQVDLPRLYKSSDAFVLPSRGEGWGRPLVEAMAMSLPVIATNWSGPMEYLTEDNGYPLPIAKMSEVMEGPFKGHLWAEPSVERLQALMRHVMSNAEEAKAKGRRAREDMISQFSPEIVAETVINQIHTILSERT
ncbi:hypothetical protein Nepgr_001336 [Nepenthes gracilis]|uniref:Glycosyl transferase family 1 domain-containing protein n=1 Tax=Nepenthes gracilis TaxID=150966 RepID=A0AAD3P8D3_NEPGR|nr:hypothetical protein Nepgr_001336 [Nepenthes gracilis]